MNVEFHRTFKKMYTKQPKKVQEKFDIKLGIFLSDPFDEQLRNHALTGALKAYRSIDVTGDVRAWYEPSNDTVTFMKIGTHSELYG